MSLQNLLEMEQFDERIIKNSPSTKKPKPRPRKATSSQDEQPRPKPRKIVEKDIDDVLSMSSVSSEDATRHTSAAFDNPVFQNDEDSGNRHKRSPPTKDKHIKHDKFQSSESESERSDRSNNKKKKTNASKIKSREMHLKSKERNYIDEDEDLSSAWNEEESYLCIENEAGEDNSKEKRVNTFTESFEASPGKSGEISKIKPSPTKTKKLKKSEGHIAIQVEEPNLKPKESPKTQQKAAGGSIWKRFLSKSLKSQSSQQSEEITTIEKSSDKKEKTTTEIKKSKSNKGSVETVIDILSEDSSSTDNGDDEEVKSIPELRKKKEKSNESVDLDGESKISKKEPQEKLVTEKIHEKLKYLKLRSKKKESVSQTITIKTSEVNKENIRSPKKVSRSAVPRKKPEKLVKTSENLLFGITIHFSDLLPMDPNILHPVVKVTLMTQDGKFIPKSISQEIIDGESNKTNRKGKYKRNKRMEDSEGNSSILDSILPMMTQPFRISRKNPTFAPTWNELLLYEEYFQKLLENNENLILFFEVMDFLPMARLDEIPASGFHGSDVGWYKIAWAFLKPVAANGVYNIDRKLRLQLFKPLKLRRKENLENTPEVYSWWKSDKREKLQNTTLYVTVKGVIPPCSTKASIRQLLSMRKEDLTEAIIESQLAPSKEQSSISGESRVEKNARKKRQVNWSRVDGQSCKVPNKMLASLPSSQINSLDITISGNVQCLKFSPCGLMLAASLHTEQLNAVLIFEIPSGNLLRSLKNHHGLIYDLAWKQFELDSNSHIHYLASASADSTSIVWRMKNNNENTWKIVKMLHHPTFVYCVDFHPTQPSLVVTGCFDNIIRIWNIELTPQDNPTNKTIGSKTVLHDSCPLFILDRHNSFVNTLIFDCVGTNLFSGDGDSWVYKWSIKSPSKKRTWKIDKEVKLSESGGIPINSLHLHPNGSRLLVHLRDNCLKILDVTTFIQIQTIKGFINDRLQIRSCFSPCGNLIISGSEKPTICIWDADTGAKVQFISQNNHPNCFVTSVDYHPFDFYMAVGLASTISEPNPILLYAYEAPKLANVALVQTGVAKFKSNLRKSKSPGTNSNSNIPFSRKSVTFAPKRGDSSEKFLNIITKLDKALQDAQNPKRLRQSASFPISSNVNQTEEKSKIVSRRASASSIFENEQTNPKLNYNPSNEEETEPQETKVESRKKHKSKSPRTYIEDKLEELILPQTNQNESKESENPVVEDSPEKLPTEKKEERQNDTTILSPENLPKTIRRERPTSSKIPIRCQPNSPSKGSGDISSSSPTNSPYKSDVQTNDARKEEKVEVEF